MVLAQPGSMTSCSRGWRAATSTKTTRAVIYARISKDAAGVHLATVHGDLDLASPMGKMIASMLIAVAEYESEHSGERHVARNQAAHS
jgi:hypothetical protein